MLQEIKDFKMISCVTSMHREYYDSIGKVMLESWLKYWPEEISMILYAEGFVPDIKNQRLVIKDWHEKCSENFSTYQKMVKGPALKFAKKGFSFLNSMENVNTDRLIWLDADLLFYKKITTEQINSLMPSSKLIALFDGYYQFNKNYTIQEYTNSETRKNFGAESGFIIVNSQHKNYKRYVENYKNLYLNPKHPLLNDWYDSEIVVLAAKDFLIDIEDLSQLRTTNKTQTPLNRCWLSEYMSHQKAKSKLSFTVSDLRKICNLN